MFGVNPKVVVREAGKEDLTPISKLAARAGFALDAGDFPLRFEMLLRISEHKIFVALADDQVMRGWLHASLRRSLERNPSVELGSLVIDPECRKLGVGHLLVSEAEKWAMHTGCLRMVTRLSNTASEAQAFYEHMGFESIKEQKVYHKHLRPKG